MTTIVYIAGKVLLRVNWKLKTKRRLHLEYENVLLCLLRAFYVSNKMGLIELYENSGVRFQFV